ncbi:MAG: hypothetical protein GU356_12040 [Pyrobaculum sp.]|jgi:TRAP-type C4-dicarboxylate transport system permease large subunit|nr:hypothetical protein [Pyrobaculum sp.]
MPPTPKQVKKEEGKENAKAVKAKKAVVVALLLFVVLAAFVHAQTTTQAATSGNKTKGSADKIVGEVTGWATGGAGLMITLFGAMFWAAVGIAIFHIAVSYIAPTRFQRLGAMWDAVERAKDIAIGLAVLFVIFYGIMAAAATITGEFSTETAWDLFVKIVSKPLVELYKAVFPQQPGASPGGP